MLLRRRRSSKPFPERDIASSQMSKSPTRPLPSVRPSSTLAVLPFENLGGAQEHDYLADGFTEEATTALGQIDPEHLSVIGRTSVLSYKRTTKSLAEIGRELGATYLIEGSIRAEGKRWRVTAKLIRASDQVQTWSASFDSEPSSILEFQRAAEHGDRRTNPAAAVAGSPDRARPPPIEEARKRTTCTCEGRHLWNQLTPPTNRQRRGTLRTRDRARPGVLARMGRPGRRLFGKSDQCRCTAARGVATRSGCRCACRRQRS